MTGSEADVCMIVEGAFPYVMGGVSSWIVDLISGLPDLSFHIVAIKPGAREEPWRMTLPENVTGVTEIALATERIERLYPIEPALARTIFAATERLVRVGGIDALTDLASVLSRLPAHVGAGQILADPTVFKALRAFYAQQLPSTSFHQFFWAWQTLVGGCLSMLRAPLPRARVYHSISTGFAGLYAARARVESGRPMMLTEHGIYQIEREIEITMADWIEDQIDSGFVLDQKPDDIREIWIGAFKSYALTCYHAADPVIALYGANNRIQARLGAEPERLRVIPNGVQSARFTQLADERDPERVAIGLIGRVVPIKDVRTYIRAAALVVQEYPTAQFYMLGPEDEDADYAEECRALVETLGVGANFHFTGKVRIDEWLPKLDLIALTSLSEAQPLVILEAGAAGIPVVSSNVGCCRDLLEGSRPGDPHGGIITPLVNPEATAKALCALIADKPRRLEMGRALQARVCTEYDRATVLAEYRALYEGLGAQEDMAVAA